MTETRTSTWVLGNGRVAESAEWLCPDCGGYHVVKLGGIRVGHPCERTEPPEDLTPRADTPRET